MTMLKTVRFQYGQIPMQYEIQHCTMREGENADPEMVRIHECEIKSERFFDLYQSPTSPTVDFIRASGKGTLTICLFNNHQVSAICSLFGHVLPTDPQRGLRVWNVAPDVKVPRHGRAAAKGLWSRAAVPRRHMGTTKPGRN